MIVDKINAFLCAEGKTITDGIIGEVKALIGQSFQRQFGTRETKAKSLRLSSIGKCMRQQAYGLLGFEPNGKEIDSRAKMVFFMGDVVELAVVELALAAGCKVVDCGISQKTVEVLGIEGHPDGIIHNGSEILLLEVKSMSSYSFEEFQNQKIDDAYRYQINAYMHALKLDRCCIVGLNKDAGVLHEWMVPKDETIVEDILRRIETLKTISKETLPERPYEPNSKGFFPWQCLYCAYWKTCQTNAQKVVVGGRYRLMEKMEEINELG